MSTDVCEGSLGVALRGLGCPVWFDNCGVCVVGADGGYQCGGQIGRS